MPRCRNCKEKFIPVKFNMKYCLKRECLNAFVEETKASAWKNTKKKWTNELKTTSDWMKEAQKVFNQYIRLRDKHKTCVSCESKLGSKYDAGHYFSSGGHKAVTFDEDNVHGQCVACNQYKHGNLLNYQIGIEKRIGAEKLIELQGRAHLTKKWTIEELKEIIKIYKNKVNKLK